MTRPASNKCSFDQLGALQTSQTIFKLLICFFGPIFCVYHIGLQADLRNTTVFKTMAPLPPPNQNWVHAVDSRRRLQEALQDDTVTAIETDLLMGTTTRTSTTDGSSPKIIPIMAHPPSTQSDLSMMDFLHLVAPPLNHTHTRTTHKAVKLDFKDVDTIESTLKALVDLEITTAGESGVFFLNADILPGPGRREEGVVTIEADKFLETSLHYIKQSPARIAFSLGFKTDCTDVDGYLPEDLDAMAELIAKYQLTEQGIGVVLAINARQLAKSLSSFDSIMTQFPDIQLLVWTGKGELPVTKNFLQSIQLYFQGKGMSHRIGFDCQITESYVVGTLSEFVVGSMGYYSKVALAAVTMQGALSFKR